MDKCDLVDDTAVGGGRRLVLVGDDRAVGVDDPEESGRRRLSSDGALDHDVGGAQVRAHRAARYLRRIYAASVRENVCDNSKKTAKKLVFLDFERNVKKRKKNVRTVSEATQLPRVANIKHLCSEMRT